MTLWDLRLVGRAAFVGDGAKRHVLFLSRPLAVRADSINIASFSSLAASL